jgi:hypothetical protein
VPTSGYGEVAFNMTVTAPIIHTYSPLTPSISPRLALHTSLEQAQSSIQVGRVNYKVEKYLTIQCLNKELLTDEDGNFRPTVKPHYAIAPHNGPGGIYNSLCKTLLIDSNEQLLVNAPLSVSVHDDKVSPPITIEPLKDQLKAACAASRSKMYTSYVVDNIGKKILITEHCLLNEREHENLFFQLDNMTTPTLEKLATLDSPIQESLSRFAQPLTAHSASLHILLPGSSVITPPPPPQELEVHVSMATAQTQGLGFFATSLDDTNQTQIKRQEIITELMNILLNAIENKAYIDVTSFPPSLDKKLLELANLRGITVTAHNPAYKGLGEEFRDLRVEAVKTFYSNNQALISNADSDIRQAFEDVMVKQTMSEGYTLNNK